MKNILEKILNEGQAGEFKLLLQSQLKLVQMKWVFEVGGWIQRLSAYVLISYYGHHKPTET